MCDLTIIQINENYSSESNHYMQKNDYSVVSVNLKRSKARYQIVKKIIP